MFTKSENRKSKEARLAKSIGNTLGKARKERRMTREEASELLGTSFENYCRIERGTRLPSLLSFARMIAEFHVTADQLCGSVDVQRDESTRPGAEPCSEHSRKPADDCDEEPR